MSARDLVGAVLALTAAAAVLRLVLWRARGPAEARAAPWRLAALLAAQPLLAWLLFVALFPPPGASAGAGALVVATRDAPRLAAGSAGAPMVVLPEAPPGLGGEPAPDLATALRRHPEVTRLRVVGAGLEPRDQEAVAGRAVAFDPAPPPRGFAELYGPATAAPGDRFTAAGRIDGVPGGRVELRDPAGRVVDRATPPPSGAFELAGAAGEPGQTLFSVAVRDRADAVVEIVDLPLVVEAPAAAHVLLLAGAPGPEVKVLRRWSTDAGVDLRTVAAAGAGLELGDPRPALTAAVLDRLDLVVVDERSWATLSSSDRAALASAVRRGLGLLLRVTGPPAPAVREQWSGLGLPLSIGEETAPVRLPAAGAPAPGAAAPPELTRRGADAPAAGSTPLLRDVAGAVLARWRPFGEGRLGVWMVSDSSGLATAGFGDRYGELWAALFSTLGRAGPAREATLPPWIVAGRRATVCGLAREAEVRTGAAAEARVLPDPRSGCGGYWPREGGWRVLRTTAEPDGVTHDRPIYVHPAGRAPGLIATEDRLATQALVTDVAQAPPRRAGEPAAPGPSGRWWLLWIGAAGVVWWLERAPLGRRDRPRTAA